MAPPARLGFLHTSEVHRPVFESLVAELGRGLLPGVESAAVVDADLLALARDDASDPALVAGIDAAVGALGPVDLVVCTCSTIGALAEARAVGLGVPIVRVDRAMADRAAAVGGPVVAVIAVSSTVEPTGALLEAAGIAAPTLVLADGAWERFEAGDVDGYLGAIEAEARRAAAHAGVIVLAQSSMAPVADRLGGTIDGPVGAVEVLAAPRIAVADALERLAASSGHTVEAIR